MKREPKYTPAPWLADRKRIFTNVNGQRLTQVARVYLHDSEEGKANLRLIVSAPRIFELLEDLYVVVDGLSPDLPALAEVRELLLFVAPMVPDLPFPDDNPFPSEVA